jgi:hypothetical protein
VRFFNAKRNIDVVQDINLRLYLDDSFSRPDWEIAEEGVYCLDDCKLDQPADCSYYSLPSSFSRLKDFGEGSKLFSDFLYQNKRLELLRIKGNRFESTPEESLGDFKVRFNDHLREQKEEAIEKLRNKYQSQQDRLEQKLSNAFDKLDKEQVDVKAKTTDSIISFGVKCGAVGSNTIPTSLPSAS